MESHNKALKSYCIYFDSHLSKLAIACHSVVYEGILNPF